MFLPTGLLNRHLRLSRASPSTDHRSSARSDAAMTEVPGSARLGADPSLGDRAFPKPWLKCARTLSHQTPQSACSSLLVLWFTLLWMVSFTLLWTQSLLLPARATSPLGFILLAWFQVSVLPLLFTLHTLIRGSPAGPRI